MTIAIFWPLVVGIIIGAFIVAAFDAPRFWSQHEWAKEANTIIRDQAETITDLESRLVPTKWDEPPPHEELQQRHPTLITEGQEVIRIDTQGDIPEADVWIPTDHPLDAALLEDWRNRVGDNE